MFLHVLVHSLLREEILIDMRNFYVSKLSHYVSAIYLKAIPFV